MLKVKKTTYGAIPKNNKLLKLTSDIKNAIQKIEEKNPLNDVSAVPAIDNTSNLKDVFGKIDKLGDLWDRGTADVSLIR